MQDTGYTTTSAKFDCTAIENPYYETTSKKDSLIEEMKNNQVIMHDDLVIRVDILKGMEITF